MKTRNRRKNRRDEECDKNKKQGNRAQKKTREHRMGEETEGRIEERK